MPVNKPTFAYKLAVEPDPRDSLDLSLQYIDLARAKSEAPVNKLII